MSNPTNNFSSDLDPYDRLAQMLDGGLFKLLPLPPSWAKYVGAQYAQDPSLLSAPAPAIPGFRKLPDLMEAPAPIGVGPTSFDPLPITPLGASNTPGFDKSPAILDALAAADPRPPGFYRSPALLGLRAFLPGRDPDPMSAAGPQSTQFDAPGLPPNIGLPDTSSFMLTSYPSTSPPMTGIQTAPQARGPSIVFAQANSTPMNDPRAGVLPTNDPNVPLRPTDLRILQTQYNPHPQMSPQPDQTPAPQPNTARGPLPVPILSPNLQFRSGIWTGSGYSAGVDSPSFLALTPRQRSIGYYGAPNGFDAVSKAHDLAQDDAQQALITSLAAAGTLDKATVRNLLIAYYTANRNSDDAFLTGLHTAPAASDWEKKMMPEALAAMEYTRARNQAIIDRLSDPNDPLADSLEASAQKTAWQQLLDTRDDYLRKASNNPSSQDEIDKAYNLLQKQLGLAPLLQSLTSQMEQYQMAQRQSLGDPGNGGQPIATKNGPIPSLGPLLWQTLKILGGR